jgi:superfamily II DNA/RNA helicase
MARVPRWQDPSGLETINTIVEKLIPTWTDGLHAVQLELVSAILDGKDVLCCTATGDGKSAAFSVPTLVLSEYNKHPEAYVAGLPTRKRPIGVVVTPTKGLADNIVRLFVNSRRSAHDFWARFLNFRNSTSSRSHIAKKP